MAAEMIVAMKEIQPHDPYRLAGYSSGAILAYAIAEQLLRLDEAVSFMAFIDVSLPAVSSNALLDNLAREFVLDRCGVLRDAHRQVLERDADQSSVFEVLEKAQQLGALPSDYEIHNELSMYQRATTFHRSLQSYRIPSLPIEIHQFFMKVSLSQVVGYHMTDNPTGSCQ
ncbi:thioesterase domain-containing protein [Bradyrhizobium sp. STM 3566]|uniref:thioesterase domain-containing protein n=1 Tax=Bradyrhizobium sp. STM 3566 TaxID=578928 RepID=UPI00388D59CA